MKETDERRACYLELPGGLNGVDYPQKFVRAPMSAHPRTASVNGRQVPVNDECMKISMGR